MINCATTRCVRVRVRDHVVADLENSRQGSVCAASAILYTLGADPVDR